MIRLYLDDVDIQNYGLLLEDYAVGMPSMHTTKISIPGRNGDLDYSNAITGHPTYTNRTLQIRLGAYEDGLSRDSIYTRFINKYIGKNVKVRFSNLEGYFVGTIGTMNKKTDLLHLQITFNVDCQPFRIVKSVTKTIQLSSTKTKVLLDQLIQPTIPTITTTGSASFSINDVIINVNAGTRKLGFELTFEDKIEVSGNGTLTIEYNQEVI